MVEARPKVALTSQPTITIGDINDITGTISDKNRYLLNTGGTRINPATEDTLSNIKTDTSNIASNTSDIKTNTSNIANDTSDIVTNTSNIASNTSKLDVNLSTRASESTLSSLNSKVTKVDTDNVVLTKISGTTLTGRDWSGDFAKLQNLIKADTDNVKINQSVASAIKNNQVTVGTSRTSLGSNTSLKFGVVVRADPSNTGNVYVGNSGVTTSSGYLLAPGDAISIEIDNVNKVYVIADTANQKVYWIGV